MNYDYKITALECDAITLNNTSLMPLDAVCKNFIHAYCRTCHSFQGTSLSDRLSIFDWKFAPSIASGCTRLSQEPLS